MTFKTLYLEKQFENHCETIANIRVENKPPKDINGVPSLTPHFSLNREGEGEKNKGGGRSQCLDGGKMEIGTMRGPSPSVYIKGTGKKPQ